MSLIEYYDPDGLFPLIESDLRARLPLQNLHWKSHNRPLRSIAKLHVNFVKDDSRAPANGPESNAGSADTPALPPPDNVNGDQARRHQIPGLRSTPSLKIYLLSCNDTETYRSTSRSKLREWLKSLTPGSHASGSHGKVDHHDAFEWLIVHVVQVNQRASNQSAAPSRTSEEITGWPSKTASNLLDKIRLDFNTSGKNSPDRVGQVVISRLSDESPSKTIRPASSSSSAAREQETGWHDLVEKLKSLILTSFSLRVQQYEDDITAKEAQRTLPGWNFSTFFILKEGLAIAFQSVGLNEDALSIYDELSVGLEAAIYEMSTSDSSTQSTSFVGATPDMHDLVKSWTLDNASTSLLSRPVDIAQKDYRGLIVSSKISVFDFFSYIFARQYLILLQTANVNVPALTSSRDAPSVSGGRELKIGHEAVSSLTDLCQRASQFITASGRILKIDLSSGLDFKAASQVQHVRTVDQVVAAWTFAVSQQVLESTNLHVLPEPPESMQTRVNKSGDVRPLDHAGLISLATQRSDMLSIQRKILAKEGKARDWLSSPIQYLARRDIETHIDLTNSEDSTDHESTEGVAQSKEVLRSGSLEEMLKSKSIFLQTYETLTTSCIWLSSLAGRKQSANNGLADLAVYRMDNNDFASAANILARLSRDAMVTKEDGLDPVLLFLYSICLKRLHRKDEYLRTLTALLRRNAESERNRTHRSRKGLSSSAGLNSQSTTLPTSQQMFEEIIEYSRDLTYTFSVDGSSFIHVVSLEPSITTLSDRDGFRISMEVQQFLAISASFDSIVAQLVSRAGDAERTIDLVSSQTTILHGNIQTLELQTSTSTYGSYQLQSLAFHAGRVAFVLDFRLKKAAETQLELTTLPAVPESRPRFAPLTCYPRSDGVDAKLVKPRRLHAGSRRAVEIMMSTGSNDIVSGQIGIKSGTAGLRLHVADFSVESGSVAVTLDKDRPSILVMGPIAARQALSIQIPLTVEQNMHSISARLEINYVTTLGSFTFTTVANVNIDHPLNVNVQDVFKQNSVISKVHLQPIENVPMRIHHVVLHGDSRHGVRPAIKEFDPLLALVNQPVCATFRISSTSEDSPNNNPADILLLEIEFVSIKEEILDTVGEMFLVDLANSPWSACSRLLLPALLDFVETHLSTAQMESYAVSGSIELPEADKGGRMSALLELSHDQGPAVAAWVQEWLTRKRMSVPTMDLPSRIQGHTARRILIVDFTLPEMHFAHTTSLSIEQVARPSASSIPTVSIGQAIPAKVRTSLTTRWSPRKSSGGPHRFHMEVQGDANTWLIGGERRAVFTAEDGHEAEFDITLVPLRPGNALLPSVDIRQVTFGVEAEMDRTRTVSETDSLSRSQVVHIIEDMETATMALSIHDATSQGVTLLESDSRALIT